MLDDTIVSLATQGSNQAISIIRISGSNAIAIVDKIFTKNLHKLESHTINYGYMEYQGKKIDEVLVSVFKAPNSYTKEDIIEINTHGGSVITNEILQLCVDLGCRLATPGEFTKRAFLNGRIDLTKAEAVMDIINAKTKSAARLAMQGLSGKLFARVNQLYFELVELASHIEVNLDYPEYDEEESITNEILLPKIGEVIEQVEKILQIAEDGQLIKDGVKTAIIGKPNVGKSSVLNALLEEQKAIVTDIAGTTRDIVEGSILIKGIYLKLLDTAGIHDTEDYIENIGIDKAKKAMEEAQLIILVLDGSVELDQDDLQLLEQTENKKRIIAINKTDKEIVFELANSIKISAINNEIESLKDKIASLYNLENIGNNNEIILSNVRHIQLMKKAYNELSTCYDELTNKISFDLAIISLNIAIDCLSEILGRNNKIDIYDEIFSKFCVGK